MNSEDTIPPNDEPQKRSAALTPSFSHLQRPKTTTATLKTPPLQSRRDMDEDEQSCEDSLNEAFTQSRNRCCFFELPQSSPEKVVCRLEKFLSSQSIASRRQTSVHANVIRLFCKTKLCTTFSLSLWSYHDSVRLQIQRSCGCCVELHNVRRAMFEYLKTGSHPDCAKARSVPKGLFQRFFEKFCPDRFWQLLDDPKSQVLAIRGLLDQFCQNPSAAKTLLDRPAALEHVISRSTSSDMESCVLAQELIAIALREADPTHPVLNELELWSPLIDLARSNVANVQNCPHMATLGVQLCRLLRVTDLKDEDIQRARQHGEKCYGELEKAIEEYLDSTSSSSTSA